MRRGALLCALAAAAGATPLDDYVNKADDSYKWADTKQTVKMLSGATGYLLNVTSQQWLDETRAHGPSGALWTHQVLVIVPKELKVRDRGFIYITGNCNENPGVPKATDEEPLAADVVASTTGAVGVVLFQIPNCHIVFPADPQRKGRTEDSLIAWSMYAFLSDPARDPEWLAFLPMTKAAMRAMQAVQEFTAQTGAAEISGWAVSGASKRGWTAWMVGAVACDWCPNVTAVMPIVPIVPGLGADLHNMFKAYGGWTFAFTDYLDVNLTAHLDTDEFDAMMAIVDPINQPYLGRLGRLPKHVIVTSDDEFMMFEQTNLWWKDMPGEKHLTILNNAEHSTATGIVEMLETLANSIASVYHGGARPTWDFDVDTDAGEITVRIPASQPHGQVVLRHAHTISTRIRDFRWARLANDANGNCRIPEINLTDVSRLINSTIDLFGANCIAPIVWTGETLSEASPGVWKASVPKPLIGWKGMYVEAYFPSDQGLKTEYKFTTPGLVWPNTFPHADCTKAACKGHLV